MRLKDEAGAEGKPVDEIEAEEIPAPVRKEPPGASIAALKKHLDDELGQRSGIDDIYLDNTWNPLIYSIQDVGDLFDAGPLRVGYMDRSAGTDLIVLPGDASTTVLSVNPRGPKDRILQLLVDREFSA